MGERVGVQSGYKPLVAYIIITKRRKQAIGDITEEDARKEGFANAEEFKQTWLKLYGQWDPKVEVGVYDFVLDKESCPVRKERELACPEIGLCSFWMYFLRKKIGYMQPFSLLPHFLVGWISALPKGFPNVRRQPHIITRQTIMLSSSIKNVTLEG